MRCVHIGVDVERGVAAVVHDACPVELPVVVLWAATVQAIFNAASDTGLTLILASLADDAGGERDELTKVATIQDYLCDLLACDGE
jgi:hypothetical protein